MTRWTALLGFGCVLAACDSSTGGGGKELPDLQVSTLNVDFGDVNWDEPVTRDVVIRNNGELPMGLGQIVVAPDGDKAQHYEYNFSVLYDFAEAVCDDGSTNGDTKDVSTDGTTGDDSGTDDSGTKTDDTADTGYTDTGEKKIVQQVLNPGCQLPLHVTMDPTDIGLGEVQAGLLIVTMDEPTDRDLSYYRDPDEEFKLVKLEGNAVDVHGRIFFNPKTIDFQFVWAGDIAAQYSIIRNVGGGDLTIDHFEMSKSCLANNVTTPATDETDPDYNNVVLAPGESISVPIYYSPLTASDVTDGPDCGMKVYSDDPNAPSDTIAIRGNEQGLSQDTPPSVTLISPPPGYAVNSGTLQVEVDMFDANQPANSLDCKIRSAVLKMSTIGSCTPTDQSGHVVVNIDANDKLEAGVDTLEILVTDAYGQRATATTTIRYLVEAPDNDNDGDLYTSVAFGGTDCDDNDATVYPEAAELPDGKDNNCQPAAECAPSPCAVPMNPCIDEGTIMGDDDADCYIEYCPDAGAPPNGCDCNDTPTFGADTYPGAVEIPDGLDNDCDPDGKVDEGTTAYDDDGDGYNELNGDFDDSDPAINPAAIEYCDGVDNDCDDFIDNAGACIPIDSRPVILGGSQGVWADKTDIAVNESTTIGVYGFDADGDQLTYLWTQDDEFGNVAIDPSAIGPVVTLTAPDEVKNGADKYRYDIQVQVADPDGNLTWAYGYIWVHDKAVDLTLGTSADTSGCNTSTGNPALAPLLPLALLALVRRRRSEPGFAA